MAILTQKKILNVIPGTAAQLTVHCSQSDTGSEVVFDLYAGSVPFEPDGAASIQGVRKDGTGFGPVAAALDGNKCTVTLDATMTGVAGPAICELTISETGGSVSTANFALLVEPAAFPNGPIVENSVDVYQQILAYVQGFSANAAADATLKVADEAAIRAAADAYLQAEIDGLQNAVGGPSVAATADEMTDETKVYVYTGSEAGYTAGDWYYWNGSDWVSGGVYNAVAINTDKTLSVADMAADGAATGNAVTNNTIGLTLLADFKQKLPGRFVKGGVYTSGTLANYAYRLRTDAVQVAAEDTTFYIDAGYRLNIYYYSSLEPSNVTFLNASNWQTGSYTVAQGSMYVPCIQKTPEDTSAVADLSWLLHVYSLLGFLVDSDGDAWED